MFSLQLRIERGPAREVIKGNCEMKVRIPTVYIYEKYGAMGGSFGDYPIYDITMAYKPLIRRDICFKDVCIGPYVDYDKLRNAEIIHIDDFFVLHRSGENKIVIYDQDDFDNKPQKIDIFDRDKQVQKPIFFEPKISLYATPRNVAEPPRYSQPGQTFMENTIYKIIDKMEFDEFRHDVRYRFFAPTVIPQFDSGVLFKMGKQSFSWYLIDSANMVFDKLSFNYGDKSEREHIKISSVSELIKHLQQDRKIRNEYFQQQYGK